MVYRLQLAASSKIHPVSHVSQLNHYVQPHQEVFKSLPSVDAHLQFPVKILQERLRRADDRSVAQVLVRWSGGDASSATWEDKDSLRQLFPRAPACRSEERGNVSDLGTGTEQAGAGEAKDSTRGLAARPTRDRQLPK